MTNVNAPERGGILLLDPATGAETGLVDAGTAIESQQVRSSRTVD